MTTEGQTNKQTNKQTNTMNADVFFQLFVSNVLEQVINLVSNGSTASSKVLVGCMIPIPTRNIATLNGGFH
jgi:hypothetical protein